MAIGNQRLIAGMDMDTGWEERSQRFYKQDYGRAVRMLNKWISAGMPDSLLERPLFTEIRRGHIQAISQCGLDRKGYKPEYFQKSESKRREKEKERHKKDKMAWKRAEGGKSQRKKRFWPEDIKLYERMVDSLNKEICFGCGGRIKEGESVICAKKIPEKFYVHDNKECRVEGQKNYEKGLREVG